MSTLKLPVALAWLEIAGWTWLAISQPDPRNPTQGDPHQEGLEKPA